MSPKSIHKPEYQVLPAMLREMRIKADLTQTELSAALDRPQSYVSDVERGVRPLDLPQLREYCAACKKDLTGFVRRFEKEIGATA